MVLAHVDNRDDLAPRDGLARYYEGFAFHAHHKAMSSTGLGSLRRSG
jgi:hypothetical protein